MSSFLNARNTAENARRPSTTSGAKARGPSSRVATKEKPLSSGEVIPEDSASNAPPRRGVSDAIKVNGSSKTTSERHIGRVNLGRRDNLQVRTRSPVKIPLDDGDNEKSPSERFPVRPSSQPGDAWALGPKKERKNPRK